MTLVGCMRDGLENDPTILYAKGTMDLISSVFLAAALGRGVLYSAGAVLLLQGGPSHWLLRTLGTGIPESMVTELSGLGGIFTVWTWTGPPGRAQLSPAGPVMRPACAAVRALAR